MKQKTYQFHCIRDDGFTWVHITGSPRVGYSIAKGFEAGFRGEFNHLMDFRDLQPMLQIPLEKGCGQQDLLTLQTPY